MANVNGINKAVQGWGLEVSNLERGRVIQRMLWGCMNENDFRNQCEFVFDEPTISSLIWSGQKRAVLIRLSDGCELEVTEKSA